MKIISSELHIVLATGFFPLPACSHRYPTNAETDEQHRGWFWRGYLLWRRWCFLITGWRREIPASRLSRQRIERFQLLRRTDGRHIFVLRERLDILRQHNWLRQQHICRWRTGSRRTSCLCFIAGSSAKRYRRETRTIPRIKGKSRLFCRLIFDVRSRDIQSK